MRFIDADAALQDANLNYGGVYDTPLVKYFIEKQPTIDINNSDGCDYCKDERCDTCIYCVTIGSEKPCCDCSPSNRKYESHNFCPHCGKRLRKE